MGNEDCSGPVPFDPDNINQETALKIIDLQTLEIQARLKEHDLRVRELELQHEYSMRSLGVQVDVVKQHNQTILQSHRDHNRTGLYLCVLVAIILCSAMFSGHVDVALDLIKMIGSAVLGWIGATGYAARKASKGDSAFFDNKDEDAD